MPKKNATQAGQGDSIKTRGATPLYYTFAGEPQMLDIIEQVLSNAGFKVSRREGKLGFTRSQKKQYEAALALMLKNHIPGWWKLNEALVRHGICTQAEFDADMGRDPKHPTKP